MYVCAVQVGSPRVREDPLGTPPPSLSAKKVSENLEEVSRIWEGEGYWRSEILNPINNDYWVANDSFLALGAVLLERRAAQGIWIQDLPRVALTRLSRSAAVLTFNAAATSTFLLRNLAHANTFNGNTLSVRKWVTSCASTVDTYGLFADVVGKKGMLDNVLAGFLAVEDQDHHKCTGLFLFGELRAWCIVALLLATPYGIGLPLHFAWMIWRAPESDSRMLPAGSTGLILLYLYALCLARFSRVLLAGALPSKLALVGSASLVLCGALLPEGLREHALRQVTLSLILRCLQQLCSSWRVSLISWISDHSFTLIVSHQLVNNFVVTQ